MLDEPDLAARFERGVEVVRAAGAMALGYFRNRDSLTVEHKGRQDLVSVADRAVEDHIRAELGRFFPDDAFLGEEGGGGEAPLLWVIDPIDGTFNFLRGIPCWCVTVAFVVDGVTELGITYDPVLDELFAARRGHGATRNGTPIKVSGRTDPTESVVGLTYSFKTERRPYIDMMDRVIAQGCEHRRLGSTAVKLCYVADGRLDALVTLRCNSWDCLGGLLMVSESGGRATDFAARHGLTEPGGILASTPGLLDTLQAAAGIEL